MECVSVNAKATLRTLLCPCNCVSRCTKLLRLCRIMWTICCLSRILHNPLVLHVMTCGPSTMRAPIKEKFYCLCKPVFLHSGESTLCFYPSLTTTPHCAHLHHPGAISQLANQLGQLLWQSSSCAWGASHWPCSRSGIFM